MKWHLFNVSIEDAMLIAEDTPDDLVCDKQGCPEVAVTVTLVQTSEKLLRWALCSHHEPEFMEVMGASKATVTNVHLVSASGAA